MYCICFFLTMHTPFIVKVKIICVKNNRVRYESELFFNVVNGRGIVSWAEVDNSKPDAHGDEPIGFVTARVVVATESEVQIL
jgi:hypothetical protein